MKKTILASVGCFFLYALSPALAADMPLKGPPAPYIAPYYNWTGLYLGFNGGYGFGSSKWTVGPISTGNFGINGPVAGGTLGYNYQMGAYVLGIEADFDWANIKGTENTLCAPFGCKTSVGWLGTTRGRLGYAFDRWLPYATAGIAYGDVKGTLGGIGHADKVKVGWTAGAGVEWAFMPAWSAKLEYLYVDLGNTAIATGVDVAFKSSLVRAGVNYRFW